MFNWYLASGDVGFFWKEQIAVFSWLPQVWHGDQDFGFNGLLSLWLDYPFRVVVKLMSTVGMSWFVIEKLLWAAIFLLATYSSYKLAKSLVAPVVYAANTYFLLLFTGGQLGVAAAYALAPLVLFKFMERRVISNGLWFALLVALDLRIAFLIADAIGLYYLVDKKTSYFPAFIYSMLIASSVHLYWILPTVLASRGTASLGEQFTNPGMLKFLSFADFSHALALLHLNWPDNLFGRVYFLQPEFLLIPVLAFSSLLFTKKNRTIIFFALLALIGVFFAKGVNDPFGGIFQWMFVHIPGFVMFRDPTKFYLFTAIGYSVLISMAFSKFKNKYFLLLFALFWVFSLRGMRLYVMQLPDEYVKLKDILVADPVPSRTLWIPAKENFVYSSDVHPSMSASAGAQIDPSVKYVIVPADMNRRIFLDNYKYDPSIRSKIIAELSKTSLIRDDDFQDIAVYKNPAFSGMNAAVPQNVARQQYLANIGTGVSVLFMLIWIAVLKLL